MWKPKFFVYFGTTNLLLIFLYPRKRQNNSCEKSKIPESTEKKFGGNGHAFM